MRHLNYNHLFYFWNVAREGSIARASEQLHLTPQTISGQLKLLDSAVGEPLFTRSGRGLALTETGHLVKQYADEIFSLGSELSQRVRDKQPGSSTLFNVGIVDSIPKLAAYRILQPALELAEPVKLNCQEGNLERLLGELAVHRLDMILSDRPLPAGLHVKAYNHRLGESDVGFFSHKSITAKYKKNFPASLNNAPVLLPHKNSVLRRSLDDWFENIDVTPDVIAEFADSALLKIFGEAGVGLFPAPSAIADEVVRMYNARPVGIATGITETYYAISPERKIKHPAVSRISQMANEQVLV